MGRRIRQIRETKGRGVTGTATAAQTKKGFIWRVEAGQQNLSVKTLSRIAVALETTMADLLKGVGPK